MNAGTRAASIPRTHAPARATTRLGWTLLAVAAYAATVYLPFLGSSRTLTAHEVMVTHPAQRMLAEGSWIVPPYTSGLWLDKPPLVNWLTALSFALLGGFTEFAARLPAALSAIGLCVLVAWVAGQFLSARAALLAGLVQASCVYMYIQGRLGEIDMVFTLLVAAAHAVLLVQWGRGHFDLPWKPAALFFTLAALAVLAKGLLAVVFIGLTVLGYCALRRTWRPLWAVLTSPMMLCFFVVAGSWHLAAYWVAGDRALEEWSYNSLLRFFGLHHLGSKPFVFYFYTVPWLMLPWSIALIVGAKRLLRDARRPDAYVSRFLWSWFLAGLAFLTISFFKAKHYAFPVLPPLAILCGGLLDEHMARMGKHTRRFFVVAFVGAVLVYGVTSAIIMPRHDHRRETVAFLRAATAEVPAERKLYVIGLGQSSAYPYIAHDTCVYIDSPNAVRDTLAARDREPIWVLTLRKYQALAVERGLEFEEVAGEPVREKHPQPETIVLGRLSRSAVTTQPTVGS